MFEIHFGLHIWIFLIGNIRHYAYWATRHLPLCLIQSDLRATSLNSTVYIPSVTLALSIVTQFFQIESGVPVTSSHASP